MNSNFFSVLEQFLLLNDNIQNSLSSIIISPISNIFAGIPFSIAQVIHQKISGLDFLYYYSLGKTLYGTWTNLIPDILNNISLNLINIQYYKLNFFLVFFVSSMAFYTTLVFPKSIFQLIIEKSHIMAQQILKPIFGSHYPFTTRFTNIILFYIIYFYLYYLIICWV